MNLTNDAVVESKEAGFSIGDALLIVRKRKWMILGIVVALPMLVGFIFSKQPKVYEATATIVIESSVPQYLGRDFKDVVEMQTSWWSAQEILQTELRVLASHSQAVAVAHALCDKKIGNDPALTKIVPHIDCSKRNEVDAAGGAVQGLVKIEPAKDSHVVNLTVDHNLPEMSALVANTAAQVFAERNLEKRLDQSQGAASWLGDEYGELIGQLNEAERQLVDFKKKNNVVAVAIEDLQNDLSARRRKLSDELSIVQVRLIGVRALRDQYAALKDPMNDAMPDPDRKGESAVMTQLKQQYVDAAAKLVELRGKYLDKHPAVLAQEARLQAVREDLRREAAVAAKSIEAQYQVLLRQEHDLKAAVDEAVRLSLQLELRAIEYNRLKRNFERLSKLTEQVGGRERETSLAGHLRTNNVRIIDAALVPGGPIAPNVPRSVGIAFIAALILAFGIAYLLDILDATVKTQDDVEKTLGLVFLGVIPTIESGGEQLDSQGKRGSRKNGEAVINDQKDLYVQNFPKSTVAECCRAIRTNLLFLSPDNPAKTLLITSAGPQEGKTTSVVSLAITLAQSGLKVVVVDTDMRRPRLHRAFGMPATPQGLSKAIVGEADLTDVICETAVPGLFVLPCGATPPNPAELLHADRFKRIVEDLARRFDRVIFDSPPLGAVTDAAILSGLTDGTILVAKGGRTSRDALARAKKLLNANGRINLLGCVINDLDLSQQGGYGYYYYSRYGYYYRQEEQKPLSSRN